MMSRNWNILLERLQTPHAIRFEPKNDRDRTSEGGYKEICSRKILHEQRKVSRIENCRENGVEEEPWKHEPPKLDKMPQNADFHLGHEKIIASYIVLAYQTELTKLLKVVRGDAWTAET